MHMTIELTDDHKQRSRALAVPGGYWAKDRGMYCADHPTPRAAAAILALFPSTALRYPELHDVRDAGTEGARPYDFASEMRLGLGKSRVLDGGVKLHAWQNTDAGYLAAILRRDGGAFVGWEPGLGKTIVTAALARSMGATRTLVVCRNDVKDAVWRRQLSEDPGVLQDHTVLLIPNVKAKRERMLSELAEGRWDDERIVLVIHYEAIALIAGKAKDGKPGSGAGWKKYGRWDLLAFDEGHRLATYNPNSSKNTQMGRGLSRLRKQADHAINLTGSAIMNKGEDLFGQLHFLYPDRYRAKWADWNDRYLDYVDDGYRRVAIGFKQDKLPELRKELGVFMVYRKNVEVFPDIPEPIMQNLHLELGPEQRRAYDEMRDNMWTRIEQMGLVASNPLAQLNMLRRIATWVPGLTSVKVDLAYNEIMEAPDEQFVVFTWYKAPGRALAERLAGAAVVVDGDVPIRERAEVLRRHESGAARVLVGSIATLGESLNLQYCQQAIRLDRSWNPQQNEQTERRVHRQGQKGRVNFRDLWAADTVDTLRVLPNLRSKESLRRAVFG